MRKECRFELKPLHCSRCGAFLNEEGTCEDEQGAFCGPCSVEYFGLENIKTDKDIVWQPNYDDLDKDGTPKTWQPTKTRGVK